LGLGVAHGRKRSAVCIAPFLNDDSRKSRFNTPPGIMSTVWFNLIVFIVDYSLAPNTCKQQAN